MESRPTANGPRASMADWRSCLCTRRLSRVVLRTQVRTQLDTHWQAWPHRPDIHMSIFLYIYLVVLLISPVVGLYAHVVSDLFVDRKGKTIPIDG